MYAVDTSHGSGIAECDLVGTDADDGTVPLKERLNGPALLEANDVRCDPEIRDGSIPGTGKSCEGRKEESIDGERDEGYG